MRTFRLEKLVRDKVFENMHDMGQKIVHRKLSDTEFLAALKRKLLEEARELNLADAKVTDELADLLEVIENIGQLTGTEFQKLRQLQKERRSERGSFVRRIYVEQVTLNDTDPWVDYYSRDTERFPEVPRAKR